MKKLNNKGFSLVELIIVIAIMVILVAVLAPQFTKWVERSRISTDIQNASEIATAAQVAFAEKGTGFTKAAVGDSAVGASGYLSSMTTAPKIKSKNVGTVGSNFQLEVSDEGVVKVYSNNGTTELFPTLDSGIEAKTKDATPGS